MHKAKPEVPGFLNNGVFNAPIEAKTPMKQRPNSNYHPNRNPVQTPPPEIKKATSPVRIS
jgi:hypothetical protein